MTVFTTLAIWCNMFEYEIDNWLLRLSQNEGKRGRLSPNEPRVWSASYSTADDRGLPDTSKFGMQEGLNRRI